MWRRVIKGVAGLLTKTAAPAAPSTLAPLPYVAVAIKQEESHAALRDAVRELSKGLAKPLQQPPASELHHWDALFRSHTPNTDPKILSTDQLEALARAYYEGPNQAAPTSTGTSHTTATTPLTPHSLPRDEPRALAAWSLAAARGSVEAAYSLAVCLREGRGCSQDSSEAFSRMIALAETNNYHLAHFAAAVMLTNAEGTLADHIRAFKHFKLAAKGGVLPALHNIANAYSAGRGCKQSDHNAMLYYRASAEAGDPAGAFTLSTWLFTGRGVAGGKKCPEEAFTHALEAAHKGHPAAMFNVGAHFMQGAGVKRDYIRAAEWFEKAASVGKIAEASINLANMHVQGLGVTRDRGKAIKILQQYAPYSKACRERLEELQEGEGVARA